MINSKNRDDFTLNDSILEFLGVLGGLGGSIMLFLFSFVSFVSKL